MTNGRTVLLFRGIDLIKVVKKRLGATEAIVSMRLCVGALDHEFSSQQQNIAAMLLVGDVRYSLVVSPHLQ